MHRKPSCLALVLLLLFLPGTAPADATLPAPFEARYEGSRFPFSARATLALSRTGEFYKYTLHGAVYLGFYRATEIYDCSIMQLHDGTLRPLEYVHRDSRKRERNLHTHFDWERGRARTVTGDGSVREIDGLQRVVWDVMSIQTRLRMAVPQAAPGETYEYTVVHRGELRRHRARIAGSETIATEEGVLETVKVRTEGPERVNWFWFAGAYAWLPVRLTVSDVTLQLASPPEDAARPVAPPTGQRPAC